MKKAALAIAALALLAVTAVFLLRYRPVPREHVNYFKTSARLAKKGVHGSQLAWAVAYSISTEYVHFVTAAHAIEKIRPDDLQLNFGFGKIVSVEKVRIATDNVDLALVSVARTGIEEGEDFVVQTKGLVDTIDEGKTVYLLGEELYGEQGRFSITSVRREGGERYFLLPGRVDKGRSGSPVFVGDRGLLIGIVQGYYAPKDGAGEQIQAISVYQAERLFR